MTNSIAEEDYYFNTEGLMVFTAKYHLKRGTCCGMKCLHCPFEHINVKPKQDKISSHK